MKTPTLRIRYHGRCWKGQQWAIQRRWLGILWLHVDWVYGERSEAEAEMALWATNT